MSEYSQVVKEGAQKVGRGIRRFFLWLLIILIVGGILFLVGANLTYSDGTRAGTLTKMTYKGVVFRTYEGELNLGGVQTNKETGLMGNIWDFSVQDKELYQTLQDYQGKKVKLYYRQKFKGMPWQGKTDYFVYKVDPINED